MMNLVYSKVNSAWMFMFGDAPCRFADEELFFPERWIAVSAANGLGLDVTSKNEVRVMQRDELDA